jgi:hypothetical protein
MQHVINRQVIELSVGETEGAFALQQQVSTQFYQQVLPILQRVFDALGEEGELISIDRLVVDLGVIPEERIRDGGWMDELYSKLMVQAEALIRDGGGRRAVVRRPVAAGIVGQWLAYMRTGRLPWNVTAIDDAWMRLLLEYLAADHGAVSLVRETLAREPVVLRRVVEQHDERFLVSLAEVLTARNQTALPGALAELGMMVRVVGGVSGPSDALVSDTGPLAAEVRVLWMAALRLAAEGGLTRTSVEIVKALLEAVVLGQVGAAVVREQLKGRVPFCEPLLEEIGRRGDAVAGVEIRDRRADITDREVKGGKLKGGENPKREALHRLTERILAPGLPEGAAGGVDPEIAEGIFVPYAGLVLLHPFLGAFFSRLGLVIDYEFVDEVARERCVHLLQHLATGETEMPEYELVMAKLLCAFPLEAPVARQFEPTAAELEEAGALLDACLSQWTVLNNTSREGLRGNFLNRAGKLYSKEGRLRLEVERSSIDVLLDYLPWNLSLVKLPWMQEMLYVNWR